MQGTIHRLIRGKGFGFIQTEPRQYFFHHSEVRGIEFRQLTVGDVVEFQPVEEAEGKNPRAVEVLVVVKAPPPPPRAPQPSNDGHHAATRPARGPRAPGPRAAAGPGRRPRAPRQEGGFGPGLFQESGGDGNEFGGPVDDAAEFSEELTQEGYFDVPVRDSGNSHSMPSSSPHAQSRRPERAPAGPGGPRGRGPRGGRRGGVRSRGEDRSNRPKATGQPGERGEGIVRSINVERGFGFIETTTGDLFFHKSGVKEGFESLDIGSRVAFVFGEGDRGAKAEDISAV